MRTRKKKVRDIGKRSNGFRNTKKLEAVSTYGRSGVTRACSSIEGRPETKQLSLLTMDLLRVTFLALTFTSQLVVYWFRCLVPLLQLPLST